MKVANDNNIEIDDQALDEMVDAAYLNDNGTKKTKISRKSVREVLVNLPEIIGYSEESPVQESFEK